MWKDIMNYEGLYQVSNLGNIKSLNNKTNHKKPIILKQTIDREMEKISRNEKGAKQ